MNAKKVVRLARRAAARCRAEATAAGAEWWASARPYIIRAERAGRDSLRRAIIATPPLIERAREGARPGALKAVALARAAGERARIAAPNVLGWSREAVSLAVERGRQMLPQKKRFRNWTLGGFAALGAIIALTAPKVHEDGEQIRPVVVSNQPMIERFDLVSTPVKEPEPEDRWPSISARLDLLDRLASASIDRQIAGIDGIFDKAKEGARAFADDALSLEGKAKFSLTAAENASRAAQQKLHDTFGKSIMPSPALVYYDPFADFLSEKFQGRLIDPEELEKASQSARARCASEITAEEARLIVELQLDLAGDGFGPMDLFAPWFIDLGDAWESVLASSTEAATHDLGALVVQEVASAVISNQVEKRINSASDSSLKKAATSFIVGNEVGNAIGGAAKMAGFDPREKLAASVREALGKARDFLVIGELRHREVYSQLLIFSCDHPDPAVRAAASEAKALMERECGLGLEYLLRESEARRGDRRRRTLLRLVRGPAAEQVIQASQSPLVRASSADALKFANSCIAHFSKED
ncbi:hypothetical protein TA3x_001095 [Tundrisphaera sp. TA3]|uniref:hypothetical protein n=1 Tax=Tundrisphaera sp. TA3 TaxID=3435775 RepID=UPI003EC146C3